MKNDGCIVTAKQCENKYKALKMECRATFDHNSKCGHDRQSYTFFNEFSKLHVYMVWSKQFENRYKSPKRECTATIDHNSKRGHDILSYAFFYEFGELYMVWRHR